jgi:hypothetical protein
LHELGRDEETIGVCDEVLARTLGLTDSVKLVRTAEALATRGVAWRTLGRADKARAAFAAVSARFGDAEEPGVKTAVASAQKQLDEMAT